MSADFKRNLRLSMWLIIASGAISLALGIVLWMQMRR